MTLLFCCAKQQFILTKHCRRGKRDVLNGTFRKPGRKQEKMPIISTEMVGIFTFCSYRGGKGEFKA
jgi:hypothetical protein